MPPCRVGHGSGSATLLPIAWPPLLQPLDSSRLHVGERDDAEMQPRLFFVRLSGLCWPCSTTTMGGCGSCTHARDHSLDATTVHVWTTSDYRSVSLLSFSLPSARGPPLLLHPTPLLAHLTARVEASTFSVLHASSQSRDVEGAPACCCVRQWISRHTSSCERTRSLGTNTQGGSISAAWLLLCFSPSAHVGLS